MLSSREWIEAGDRVEVLSNLGERKPGQHLDVSTGSRNLLPRRSGGWQHGELVVPSGRLENETPSHSYMRRRSIESKQSRLDLLAQQLELVQIGSHPNERW